MHPCLHIDELLESIAAEVSSGGSRELVAMALTCQAFYEPAMNRLWRDLPGLVPLISCLPRARLSRTRTRGGFDTDFDYFLNIVGTPLPHEWERVRTHARRVRTLSLHEVNSSYMPPSLDIRCYETLKVHYPELPMLPNLRSLKYLCDGASSSLTPYFGQLVPPTLSEVDYGPGTAADIIRALECLQESAAALRIFKYPYIRRPVEEIDSALLARLTNTIQSFHHLTNLTLSMPYEDEAILHIASLPELSSFNIVINNNNCRSLVPSGSTSTAFFPSLQQLEINGLYVEDDTYNITQFLGSIQPHSLKSLRIDALAPPRVAPASDLMDAIATHRTIEILHITFMGGHSLRPSSESRALLRPLERLSSLASIDLVNFPVTFTGPNLGRLAFAWPDLKTFNLRSCWTAPSQVRFCDLIPFAKRCRQLKSVAFIAAPYMPPYDDFSREEHLQEALSLPSTFVSPLEYLSIGSEATSADLAPQIGAFLANYFPAVETVMGASADGRMRSTLGSIIIAKQLCLEAMAQGEVVGGEVEGNAIV